mmetsp:Transcript_39003/g.122154  ORF Transcript_39003/g.122154 Transcript_39003/m.122154 type:complete len:203 (+) Transcript_39003:169-777(+)
MTSRARSASMTSTMSSFMSLASRTSGIGAAAESRPNLLARFSSSMVYRTASCSRRCAPSGMSATFFSSSSRVMRLAMRRSYSSGSVSASLLSISCSSSSKRRFFSSSSNFLRSFSSAALFSSSSNAACRAASRSSAILLASFSAFFLSCKRLAMRFRYSSGFVSLSSSSSSSSASSAILASSAFLSASRAAWSRSRTLFISK